MDWMTTVLTAVCIATTGGIVVNHHLAENADPENYVPATALLATSASGPDARPHHVDHVKALVTPDVKTHELAVAAHHWHEILADARRENRRLAQQPPRSVNPTYHLTSAERQRRYQSSLREQRMTRDRLKRMAADRRLKNDRKSIFTRSERYRRAGSAYPANNLNRQLRRTQRRAR